MTLVSKLDGGAGGAPGCLRVNGQQMWCGLIPPPHCSNGAWDEARGEETAVPGLEDDLRCRTPLQAFTVCGQ